MRNRSRQSRLGANVSHSKSSKIASSHLPSLSEGSEILETFPEPLDQTVKLVPDEHSSNLVSCKAAAEHQEPLLTRQLQWLASNSSAASTEDSSRVFTSCSTGTSTDFSTCSTSRERSSSKDCSRDSNSGDGGRRNDNDGLSYVTPSDIKLVRIRPIRPPSFDRRLYRLLVDGRARLTRIRRYLGAGEGRLEKEHGLVEKTTICR